MRRPCAGLCFFANGTKAEAPRPCRHAAADGSRFCAWHAKRGSKWQTKMANAASRRSPRSVAPTQAKYVTANVESIIQQMERALAEHGPMSARAIAPLVGQLTSKIGPILQGLVALGRLRRLPRGHGVYDLPDRADEDDGPDS